MRKVFLSFLCLCVLVISAWASRQSREIYRYIIPEGATEVAIVEEAEYSDIKDKLRERPSTYDRYDFDMKAIPPETKIIFYDKDGNKLDAKIKPAAVKHIKIDNLDDMPVIQK